MASKVIEGADHIVRSFELLGQAASVRTMRRAMGKSLRPTAKKLRSAAPVGSRVHKTYKGALAAPGHLRRNITVTTRAGKDRNRVFGTIRPKAEAWYGSLLEHGWRPGRRSRRVKVASNRGSLSDSALSKLGDNRVKVPGNKWWSSAMKGEEERIVSSFSEKIFEEIEKEWSK